MAAARQVIPSQRVRMETGRIAALQRNMMVLEAGTTRSAPQRDGHGHNSAPQPQVRIPPTYIAPLRRSIAALVGYPLAGFVGSFLAVPMVGLTHVLVKQAYASWKAKNSTSAEDSGSVATRPDDAATPDPDGIPASAPVYAASRVEN